MISLSCLPFVWLSNRKTKEQRKGRKPGAAGRFRRRPPSDRERFLYARFQIEEKVAGIQPLKVYRLGVPQLDPCI
jgi:hypothetical protein